MLNLVVDTVTTGLYGVHTVGILVTRKCPVPSADVSVQLIRNDGPAGMVDADDF